jgi:hypothetical protein
LAGNVHGILNKSWLLQWFLPYLLA